jgi:predicted PolB exonuclease-like 3'-5' exonuclease
MDIDKRSKTTFIDADERKLLTDFWKFCETNKMLYGFNTDSFDTPFIHIRSLVNGVNLVDVHTCDLRAVLFMYHRSPNNAFKKGRLHDFARHFGIEPKTGSGKEVIDNWNLGKFDEIVKHCEEDLEMTHAMFTRMKSQGFLL